MSKYVVNRTSPHSPFGAPVFCARVPPVRRQSIESTAERMRQQDMSRREYELRNFGKESDRAER